MMTPKTISNSNYYSDLASEDYYNNGKEPAGKWMGKGADALGLKGNINKVDFAKIINGYDLKGVALKQNSGKANYKKGEDLCFSAPKSVTLARRLASPDLAEKIHKAELCAVAKALNYVESISMTRAGPEKKLEKIAGATFAVYEHSTSRAVDGNKPDPQDHYHCLFMSSALCADGKTRAVEFKKSVYEQQITIGTIFRAELANELRHVGFDIQKDGDSFKIAGIDEKMCAHFSKRDAQVKASTPADASPAKKALVALNTRTKKGTQDNAGLAEFWKKEAFQKFGVNEQTIDKLANSKENKMTLGGSTNNSILSELSKEKKFFTEKDLRKKAAYDCQNSGRDFNERFDSLKATEGLNQKNEFQMTFEPKVFTQNNNKNSPENILSTVKILAKAVINSDPQKNKNNSVGGRVEHSKVGGAPGGTQVEKALSARMNIELSIKALDPKSKDFVSQQALLLNALKDAGEAVVTAEMQAQKQVVQSQIQGMQM